MLLNKIAINLELIMSLLGVYIQSIASKGQRTYIIYSGILALSKEPISWNPTNNKCKNPCCAFYFRENAQWKLHS